MSSVTLAKRPKPNPDLHMVATNSRMFVAAAASPAERRPNGIELLTTGLVAESGLEDSQRLPGLQSLVLCGVALASSLLQRVRVGPVHAKSARGRTRETLTAPGSTPLRQERSRTDTREAHGPGSHCLRAKSARGQTREMLKAPGFTVFAPERSRTDTRDAHGPGSNAFAPRALADGPARCSQAPGATSFAAKRSRFTYRPVQARRWLPGTGRATQVFVTCRTKARVEFPSEAQGWFLMHRCGLDDNQKAVVKAQTAGEQKTWVGLFEAVSRRILSEEKREHIYAVDDEEDFETAESTIEAFEDVESFLAESDNSETEATTLQEEEVRDVLAVSWKDRRREIAAAKASRNFTRVRELQLSFRKEVDDLKKRTKCHRCGGVGHWARDCRVRDRGGKGGKGERKGVPPHESQESSSGAFACITMTEKIEENQRMASAELFLTTAHGVCIVDSGCGKSVIGRRTLRRYLSALPEGQGSAEYREDKHLFRFGNDTTEASKQSAQLPVGIGGKRGSLRVSVLDGKADEAPLLISKPALRSLGAVLDFENSVLQLKRIGADIKLKEGPTGHYLLDLFQFPVLHISEGIEKGEQKIFPDESAGDSTLADNFNVHVGCDRP